jgi:putative endonuclease
MIRKMESLLPRRRAAHLEFGKRGELIALRYLKEVEGYLIAAMNFRVPVGRGIKGQKLTAEIDLIAYDGGTLVFVEVKTRASREVVAPETAVDLRKKRQIARAARRYRRLLGVMDEPYRYDVVTVVPESDGYRVELLRGYFDDSVFRRASFWRSDA